MQMRALGTSVPTFFMRDMPASRHSRPASMSSTRTALRVTHSELMVALSDSTPFWAASRESAMAADGSASAPRTASAAGRANLHCIGESTSSDANEPGGGWRPGGPVNTAGGSKARRPRLYTRSVRGGPFGGMGRIARRGRPRRAMRRKPALRPGGDRPLLPDAVHPHVDALVEEGDQPRDPRLLRDRERVGPGEVRHHAVAEHDG